MTPRPPRDLALDLLRGYFLVVILIDHLRFAKNPLYVFSGNQSLWVTAAEGFVLVSGFLVGKLRGAEARTAGLRVASIHVVRRAGKLALWSAILTIAFRIISEVSGYWPAVPNADAPGSLLEWIVGAVFLRHTYGDGNLLAAYAIFMALAPLALLAMLRGRTVVLLAVSTALWLVAFIYRLRWSDSVQSDASWQLLFVIGMVAGYHEARWAEIAPARRRAILIVAGAIAITAIAASALHLVPPSDRRIEDHLFDRERLGPGRIFCALAVVASLYAAVRAGGPRLLGSAVGKFLIPLGQSSLYVYIVQAIFTFVLVNRSLADPWIAAGISLAVIAVMWILVTRRVLFGIIPR